MCSTASQQGHLTVINLLAFATHNYCILTIPGRTGNAF